MIDYSKKRIPKEKVDELIKMIDDFTQNEVTLHGSYWSTVDTRVHDKSITVNAGFNRLKGASREAFAQEVFALRDELFPKQLKWEDLHKGAGNDAEGII